MIPLIYASEVAQKQLEAHLDPWKIAFAGFFSASMIWQVRRGWVGWINAIPKMVSSQRDGHIFLSVSDLVMGFCSTTTLRTEQILDSNIIENAAIYMKNHTESCGSLDFFHNGVIFSDLTQRSLNEENTTSSKLFFLERLLEFLKSSTTFNLRAIYAGKSSAFSLALQKGACHGLTLV